MVRREFDAYGIDVVAPAKAVAALDEARTLIKRLWTEDEPFDFAGSHYRLSGAVCEPKPVRQSHPPILIGATGERAALRVVARHADIWNCPTPGSVEVFQHKSAVLDEHCAALGRNPTEITRSVQVLVSARDQPPGAPGLPRLGPAAVRDLLVGLIEAGAAHLVLAPVPPYPSVRWLADEVAAPVLDLVRR